MSLLTEIQAAVKDTELALTLHALTRMTARRIAVSEVRNVLLSAEAEVIEDYPGDPRGPSCLVYGKTSKRILHVHVSHPPEIVVITAYQPDSVRWETDLKRRKRK